MEEEKTMERIGAGRSKRSGRRVAIGGKKAVREGVPSRRGRRR
jgi:hypothetical protein